MPNFRTALSVELLSALINITLGTFTTWHLRQRFEEALLYLCSVVRVKAPVAQVEERFSRQGGHDGATGVAARQQTIWSLPLRFESHEARTIVGFGVAEDFESGQLVGGGVAVGWEGSCLWRSRWLVGFGGIGDLDFDLEDVLFFSVVVGCCGGW